MTNDDLNIFTIFPNKHNRLINNLRNYERQSQSNTDVYACCGKNPPRRLQAKSRDPAPKVRGAGSIKSCLKGIWLRNEGEVVRNGSAFIAWTSA